MSINITVHGSPVNSSKIKNIFQDPEYAKKREYEERRKFRLEQVRQQSKEIASQLRHKVENESKRQFEKIDQMKKDELLKWREKAAAQVKTDYEKTLEEIGQAHKAAEMECEREKLKPTLPSRSYSFSKFKKKTSIPGKCQHKVKVTATTIPTTRKIPKIKKLHIKTLSSSDQKILSKNPPKKSSNKIKVNDENSSNFANAATKTIKNSSEFKRRTDDEISSESSDERTLKNLPSSPKQFTTAAPASKLRKLPRKVLKKGKMVRTPPIIIGIDSDSDEISPPTEIEDVHDSLNMHYSRVTSKHKPSSTSSPPRHISPSKTYRKLISSVFSKPAQQPTRFTQISDLIRQKSQEEQSLAAKIPLKDSPRRCLKTKFDEKESTHVSRSTSVSPTKRYDRIVLGSPPRKPALSTPSSPRKQQPIQSIQLSPKRIHKIAKSDSKIATVTSPKKSIGCQVSSSIISGKKSNLKLSNQISQSQNVDNHVQFYDYNNKFEKFYKPSKNMIQSEEIPTGLNAMEQAEIETELQENRQKEVEINRIKSDERFQRALEKEKIRRDYEALTAKLDAISKDENVQKKYNGDQYLFSNIRIKNAEEQKQRKLDSKIQKVLNRPVIITCPEVDDDNLKNKKSTAIATSTNISKLQKKNFSDLNLNTIDELDDQATDNNALNRSSSDSCASILLNYVSDQTKKVSEDMANCDSMQKMKQLQNLLDKINNLRNKLLIELKCYNVDDSNVPYNKGNYRKIVDIIKTVDEEREQIMGKTKKPELEKDEKKKVMKTNKEKLAKKEKELKEKEALIDRKLKDLYKERKIFAKDNESSTVTPSSVETTDLENNNESETVASGKITTEKPIEIIIKVQNQIQSKHRKTWAYKSPIKSPFKVPKRQSHLTSKSKMKKKMDHLLKSNIIQQKPLSSPTKDPKSPILLKKPLQQEDGSTITSYRSPPNEVQTPLTHVLDSENQIAQNLRQQENSKSKNEKEIKKPLISQSTVIKTSHPKTQINPVLQHYIQRLLGMSHQAIEMLGVSTSEIETPSTSIIDNSGNISIVTTENSGDSFEKMKIERLKKFIQDNYKFLEEVEESMKKDESTTISSTSSSIKTIERIWKQTLKQAQQEKEKEKQIKSILKKAKSKSPKRKRTAIAATSSTVVAVSGDEEKIQSKEKSTLSTSLPITISPEKEKSKSPLAESKIPFISEKDVQDTSKLQLLGKYNDLAENCTQRIAELNEMINKVREEKQKILETTLSSATDTGRTSTEYADFNENIAQQDRSESSKISDKKFQSSSTRSPEKIPLEKHKVTGMSRDSGISLSRPVTALDNRESPEIPSSMQEDFEPILKDIPKPSATSPKVQIITPSLEQIATDLVTSKLRKDKPPATLGRYSPQFGEEIQLPHELSTIVEIETPATSRLNTSAAIEEKQQRQQQEEKSFTSENLIEAAKFQEEIVYRKFPSFDEYVRQNKLDLTTFDQNTISQIQVEYEEIIGRIEKSQEQIESGKITDLSNEIKNLVENLRLFNLSFKKFPTRKEYLEQLGYTDSIDSKSIDDATTITEGNMLQFKELPDAEVDAADSAESLLDVVKELKKRKMLQQSFQYEVSEKPDKLTAEDDDLAESTTTSSYNQLKKDKISPRKKLTHKMKLSKDDTMSGIEVIPTTTASSQSHSDDIEKSLERMGLTWAAKMMKKTQENKREFRSTSSSTRSPPKRISPIKSKFDEISKTIKQEFSDLTSDSSGIGGKPLNLREFLIKELNKRALNSISTSTSSSDGSASITSRFLQSLLGSSGSRSLTSKRDGKSMERVKTSTPVNTRSSTTKSPHLLSDDGGHSTKFFSGDSRLSSVRCSSSTSTSEEIKSSNDEINQKTQSS